MALPQITLVDSAVKLNQIIYEADESLQNDKVLAYLNQVGLINYNDEKECVNGHLMELKKVKRADGWWWRCGQKGCQTSESIRKGTIFYDGKIKIWVVLLMIFNFAFEYLNTTTRQLVGISVQTVSNYKKWLSLICRSTKNLILVQVENITNKCVLLENQEK